MMRIVPHFCPALYNSHGLRLPCVRLSGSIRYGRWRRSCGEVRTAMHRLGGLAANVWESGYHYQSYRSTYGIPFSLSLTAGFTPFGDELYIELARVGFSYDLKFETITRLHTDFGNKSTTMTDNGYKPDGGMLSVVEILNSFSTSFNDYDTVMYFQLLDFENKWNDLTVVNIYVAKDIGLVKFELNNGLSFERL